MGIGCQRNYGTATLAVWFPNGMLQWRELNRRIIALGLNTAGLGTGVNTFPLLRHPVFNVELFADNFKILIEKPSPGLRPGLVSLDRPTTLPILALEDGTIFRGWSFGVAAERSDRKGVRNDLAPGLEHRHPITGVCLGRNAMIRDCQMQPGTGAKRIVTVIAIILGLIALKQFAGAETAHAADAGVIGVIDFYGDGSMDLSRLRTLLPYRPGDAVPSTPELRVAARSYANAVGRDRARFDPVCCQPDGRWDLFVGLQEPGIEPLQLAPCPMRTR